MRSVSTPNPHPPPPRWPTRPTTTKLKPHPPHLTPPPRALWTWPTIRFQFRLHHPPPRNQQSSCALLSGCCWCAATFLDCRWSTNLSVLRLQPWHPRLFFSLVFSFFCFGTISLGGFQSWADWEPDTRLTQLRPEWGQDHKAPSRVYLFIYLFGEG